MNPITETRYGLVRYVVLWGLFATVYAVAFGLPSGLSVGSAALDGAVFGVVAGFEGLILWSVLKYGTVGMPTAEGIAVPLLKAVYRTAVGILFVAVATGAETTALWLVEESLPRAFVATIPARCLTTAAVYVCFVLWYSSAIRSESEGAPETRAVAAATEKNVPSDLPESLERITVKGAGGRIEVIDVGNIVYIQAEGDYVAIATPDGRWLKEGTMKWFEEALPQDRFVRVHRSYIVAVDHISRIETSGREHTLILRAGGKPLRISDTGYRLLKRKLGL